MGFSVSKSSTSALSLSYFITDMVHYAFNYTLRGNLPAHQTEAEAATKVEEDKLNTSRKCAQRR